MTVSEESSLKELRKEYLQAIPPMQIKSLQNCLINNFENVYKWTLEKSKSNPPVQYRISFVKHVIKQIEFLEDGKNDDDLLELWYDAFELLSSFTIQSEPFYRLYDIFDDESKEIIKIFENEAAFVAEGTTGLVTWEASKQLAKWLMSSASAILEEQVAWVLELGCGCGFLAIATVKILPQLRSYVATDGHPGALSKGDQNVKANFGDNLSCITFSLIDWVKDEEKFLSTVKDLSTKYGTGLLVGADIVFDPELIPPLIKLLNVFVELQATLQKPGKAILSCTIRNEATVAQLREQLDMFPNLVSEEIHNFQDGLILQTRVRTSV